MTAERVKVLGRECGFDLVRIGPADDMPVERRRYLEWIQDGRQGEMGWITTEHAERSSRPRAILPAAQSVISLGMAYWSGVRTPSPAGRGRIARYAWGEDYHGVLGERLDQMVMALKQEFGGAHAYYVDTGPAMDKALAARAGLGWYGKNTNILTEKFGSFVLLGEIITTLPLGLDVPLARTCGSCRLCQIACPTGALDAEYSIDSRRCISYLTIEHRGPIPLELRPLMGDWVFGCDICQDVCPPSREPYFRSRKDRLAWVDEIRDELAVAGKQTARPDQHTSEPQKQTDGFHPTPLGPLFAGGVRQSVDLQWLLRLAHDEYLEVFRGTSIRRAKVWMLRRNAAVALGNVGDTRSLELLQTALREDEHPIVRGHAAWALGALRRRHSNLGGLGNLVDALAREEDESVRTEIRLVLSDQAGTAHDEPTGQ